MNTQASKTKLTILYILIAFLFSVAVRMVWAYQFSDVEAYKFNGQFMINTNDGYFWAEGARDLLSGVTQENDLSPIMTAPAQLTAFFAMLLPFSFETIIFFMPALLSSLVVIPIILIARGIDNLEMGFIAALLGSVAHSYYNRTMIGYYDTDMLNIVLPMFLLWSIIWAIKTNENKYLLITALDVLVYRWWYPQSYSLEFAFFGLILLYALIYDRKNMYNYKLLAIMMFAMLNIDFIFRVPLVLVVLYLFKVERFQKYTYHLLALSIVAFLASGGLTPIWGMLKGYIFRDAISVDDEGLKLHFFSVMQTVREAGQIPFEVFANRISGHIVTFLLSVAGFAYLAYRHKIMLFALPLIGLGFLASVGGLRFTIYAVPILAFGIAFLITEFSSKFPKMLGLENDRLKYLSMLAMTLAILYPNIQHANSYSVPTVFSADEVTILDTLKTEVDREDYVIAWWDYGYPLRYYADVKTLIDGAQHSGSANFPVSYMLTNPQDVSAKMARLDVEYTEKAFRLREENKDKDKDKNITRFSNIEEMTKEYGFNDTNDFLASLKTDINMPEKTRDIYFYLPFRMLDIYPTVTVFSNLNLMNGEEYAQPLMLVSKRFSETATTLELGRGVSFLKKEKSLKIGNNIVPVKRFVKTFYDAKGVLQKEVAVLSNTAEINVIYMSNYNTFLVLDEKSYNSLYIQLMVMEEYDETLFEKVVSSPHAKVYKLKI